MRRQVSIPFLTSENEFLWFALTCRESGIPASVRLELDETLGLDIDNAITLRLIQFDNERAGEQAKRIAYEVSKIFGSSESESATSDLGAEVW